MQSKQKSISELRNLLAEGYCPNPKVLGRLSSVSMIPVIGSLASGKTSLLCRIIASDDRFGRVQCFTTRDRRQSDEPNEFRFKASSDGELLKLAGLAEKGELVQYMIHPTNENVYGSELVDYASQFSLLETIYYAVDDLYKLSFKEVRPIYVVPDTQSWNEQLNQRSSELSSVDVKNRLIEGVKGAEWALDRAETIDWVFNKKGQEATTAAKIIMICEGEKTSPLVWETKKFITQVKETITLLKS